MPSGRLAAFTILLALTTGQPAPAQDARPQAQPQPPTIIPEKLGPAVPVPEGAAPVRPTLELPLTQHRFTGLDRLDEGEISVEGLIGRPLLGQDGQPAGLVTDVVLENGTARGIVIAPAAGSDQTSIVPVEQIRTGRDQPALMLDGALPPAGTAPAAEPGVTRASSMLETDIASADGRLAGQVHDLVLGRDHRIKDLVVRMAMVGSQEEVFISVPFDQVRRREGTDLFLFADEVANRLVEFRYDTRP